MLLPVDKLCGTPRGHADQFIRWVERGLGVGPYREWTHGVDLFAPQLGVDPVIIWMQGYVETAGFTSAAWWQRDTGWMRFMGDHSIQPVLTATDSALMHTIVLSVIAGRSYFPAHLRGWRDICYEGVKALIREVHDDPDRPPVQRLDDLNLSYRAQGATKYVWSSDDDYVNDIISTAATAPVQIPNQQYWHGTRYWRNATTVTVTRDTAVYEGPSHSNRRLLYLQPGDRITLIGTASGHAAKGNSTWWAIGGITHGFIHSDDAQRIAAE